MSFRAILRSAILILVGYSLSYMPPAFADSSHVRIIRLSFVQGDVRFAHETHGDPLADSKAGWDAAQLNLPIAQGNVLATDNGRAAVEFENGTMAFLGENTVVQFYELSLNDGARTTRLVLLQGSASFSVNPSGGEYFSVTGGDFTVEATTHSLFRVTNYVDGSNVAVRIGRVSVVRKKDSMFLTKGQSLSVKAGENSALSASEVPSPDNFDKWVLNRVATMNSATNASQSYTNSSSYVPGYADLFTYGGWSSCGGFGYGWRPFGAGYNWSPFASGSWYFDQNFGWTFVSLQPWGWAPYHYGGWLFDASCGGWFYSPGAYGYGYPNQYVPGAPKKKFPPRVNPPHPIYRASTAVFVKQNGRIGIVPMHPLDQKGKTPINLEHGVMGASAISALNSPIANFDRAQKFETLKSAPSDALSGRLMASTAPPRVVSTIAESKGGSLGLVLGKNTMLSFDGNQGRFVSTSGAMRPEATRSGSSPVVSSTRFTGGLVPRASIPTSTSASARGASVSMPTRSASAPARSYSPPPSPSFSGGGYGGGSSASSSRGSTGGGWSGSSSSSSGGARASASPSSSSGSSASTASSTGGGRPH